MEPHVRNYFKAFGLHKGDFVSCEYCGANGNQIHHIEPRSKFGSTKKSDQDNINNLICLCYICHERAHGPDSKTYKEHFKKIVNERPQTKGF